MPHQMVGHCHRLALNLQKEKDESILIVLIKKQNVEGHSALLCLVSALK